MQLQKKENKNKQTQAQKVVP